MTLYFLAYFVKSTRASWIFEPIMTRTPPGVQRLKSKKYENKQEAGSDKRVLDRIGDGKISEGIEAHTKPGA